MNQSFHKKAKLKPMQCSLSAFELFINEATASFDKDKIYINISIKFEGHDVDFESYDDFYTHISELPDHIYKLSLSINEYTTENRKSFRLNTDYGSNTVNIETNSLSNSAGLLEISKLFNRQNKAWHSTLSEWHFYFISMILFWHKPLIAVFGIENNPEYTSYTLYLVAVITFIMSMSYKRLFPNFKLILRNKETFIKKYSTEIMVASTIIGAIAAIYSAIYSGLSK